MVGILLALGAMAAEPPPLRPALYYVPGDRPTPWLRYQDAAARRVEVCGSWDRWVKRHPLEYRKNGLWGLDTRTLPGRYGQFNYKFVVNGDWEKGEDRTLFLNGEGILEKPSDLIFDATVEGRHEIRVRFRDDLPENPSLKVSLSSGNPVKEWSLATTPEKGSLQGYFISGNTITFVFDEKAYYRKLSRADRVVVAGNFTWWDGSGGNGRWVLKPTSAGTREMTTQLDGLRAPPGESDLLFKFVINERDWLPPAEGAPNAVTDVKGKENLRVDPSLLGGTKLRIITENAIDLSRTTAVIIEGLGPRPIWRLLTPGGVFDTFVSDKPLGANLDREHGCTTYRLFAPRASRVFLNLYDGPKFEVFKPDYKRLEPAERYPMWKDEEDGVWEISMLGLDAGRYYAFNVDGPMGNGEGFNVWASVGDPYARAVAHAENNSIVIDPDATNQWFGGWTDQDWKTPAPEDMVIYEMHVRDFSMHPSSGAPLPLSGTFEGILATTGQGAGLDHLKALGVDAVEMMPVNEFNNGTRDYSWGYSTVYFFAPEASYGRAPLKGSSYYEFKNMVNGLHRQGFAVILDLVYNHVGSPNLFSLIDKKYYFRLDPEFNYSNYSKCGNDVRTENPMVRRFLVDNILYWMKEHHVDGFRLDLAELIDMDTMYAIAEAARAANPNVMLISEPWSLRGENKYQLRGTPWAAWNNEFRYAAKDFAMGRYNRDWLQKKILGSTDTWAGHPMQSINYLESHDDMTLADEFCTRPDRDGRNLQESDIAANRLAVTIVFTSLGIPMINAGQEFLRSKRGINNTFDRGDDINAMRWTDRDRPLAAETLAYYRGLIQLRQSEAGASFRVTSRPPAGYYRWLTPDHPQALGYIVNSPKRHKGDGFIVLLNAGNEPVAFEVPFPPGRWRLISDGVRLDPKGLPETSARDGDQTYTVNVPGARSLIFKDGF
ncbi:MAG: hypothetical protein KKC51_13265 [Verrucomicrobia bacterium]|nr:hypothetical protein [Verrucomicrobiota bacterium]